MPPTTARPDVCPHGLEYIYDTTGWFVEEMYL